MRDVTVPLRFVRAGLVDYQTAWDRQRELAAARADGAAPDTVLLLEHPAVYTAGKRTQPEDRPTRRHTRDRRRSGRPDHLARPGPAGAATRSSSCCRPLDLVAYVRLLEDVLIAACADLGLTGAAGSTGAAASGSRPIRRGRPERKVAAIGVRVRARRHACTASH